MKPNKKNKTSAKGRVFTRSRLFVGFTLLVGILALGTLVYSYIPSERIKKDIPLSQKRLDDIGLGGYSTGQLPVVHIEYPARVYAGDAVSASMTLDPGGMKLADSSSLVVDFLLELDGTHINPDGETLIPITNPYPAVAKWDLAPYTPGLLNGKAWLHLQTVNSNGDTNSYLLIVAPLEIQSSVLIAGSIVIVRLICLLLFFACFVILLVNTFRNWSIKRSHKSKLD